MSNIASNGGAPQRLYEAARLPSFDVCWVGANPFQVGFCYGSEDGKLLYTDDAGNPLPGQDKGSVSGEAINGVMRSGRWLAISTRAEINFLGMPHGNNKAEASVFPHGAHGLDVLANGDFVAPLGRTGLVVIEPAIKPNESVTLLEAKKEDFYFYRALALPSSGNSSPLRCAGRRGGIGITELVAGERKLTLSTVTFDNLDVVDLCSIGTNQAPLAMAALGRDGTVILFRDALRDRRPLTMKYENVVGTAYRLLSSGGDIYLLTSTGLYGLLSLAERYLEGALIGGSPTCILAVPMEAVDANLVRDRWLMVVLPDEVRKFDVELIRREAPEYIRAGAIKEFQPQVLEPEWKEHDPEEMTPQVVPAGT